MKLTVRVDLSSTEQDSIEIQSELPNVYFPYDSGFSAVEVLKETLRTQFDVMFERMGRAFYEHANGGPPFEGEQLQLFELSHIGVAHDRVRTNPRERAFAEAWLNQNSAPGAPGTLFNLLHRTSPHDFFFASSPIPGVEYNQHAATIAATMIQWLGSNVGMAFAHMVYRDLGYTIVPPKD